MVLPTLRLIAIAQLFAQAYAHIGAWGKGMFCRNDLREDDYPVASQVATPLYRQTWDAFWFHGKCRNYPPPAGEFMLLRAGGWITLELSDNRAHTTLTYGGNFSSIWTDGKGGLDMLDEPAIDQMLEHPELDNWDNKTCITSPNIHATGFSDAAGTSLAIAYKSDINQVGIEDLVVFSVAPNSPWHRRTSYLIPADMPACPEDGCICSWNWIPNHCGQPNMYMNGFKCMVTEARPNAPRLAPPQTPRWCEDNVHNCVQGAKGLVIFEQDPSINNIVTDGLIRQKDGNWGSPSYNMKMGFRPGAQNDIFMPA